MPKMSFDDMTQEMIWRERPLCAKLNQPRIIASLIAEGASEGYEPMDFNSAGIPNLYLRAMYVYDLDDEGERKLETERWTGDGFVIFVQKKQSKGSR